MKKKIFALIAALIITSTCTAMIPACKVDGGTAGNDTTQGDGDNQTPGGDNEQVVDENPLGLNFYTVGDGSSYGVDAGEAKHLDTIEIPATYKGKAVTSIVNDGFNASSVKSIIIPDSVNKVGGGVFYGYIYLSEVKLSNQLTSLSYTIDFNYSNTYCGFFGMCTSLASVTIPYSVTSIGDFAFRDCSSLTSITFNGTISEWQAISKGSGWNSSTGTFTITCTDGKLDKNENDIS